MTSTPLIFHISPQWKQKNLQYSFKYLHRSKSFDQSAVNHDLDLSRLLTINLDQMTDNEQNIRTAGDFHEILHDIQTFRNELYDIHGSIQMQIDSFRSTRCCCNQKPSIETQREISNYETELFRNDFVEYIYRIECLPSLRNRILFQ